MSAGFLARPGAPGAVGALLDEYARAAEALCAVVERVDPAAFVAEREDPDPDGRSMRAVCEHVAFAALGYAHYLRRMQGLAAPLPGTPERLAERRPVPEPGALRAELVRALRATEDALEPLRAVPEERVLAMTLAVSWGPVYQPESMAEHAIVHLLRHRRQLERWRTPR